MPKTSKFALCVIFFLFIVGCKSKTMNPPYYEVRQNEKGEYSVVITNKVGVSVEIHMSNFKKGETRNDKTDLDGKKITVKFSLENNKPKVKATLNGKKLPEFSP